MFYFILFLFNFYSITYGLDGVDLNPIVIKGYKFFDSVTGIYYPFKGIDYYPRPNAGKLNENNLDFFTDLYSTIWSRDIPRFQQAGANTIRIYAVDPTKNHDEFMCALASAGIYAIIDLGASCEHCSITKEEAPTCYEGSLKTRGQMIIRTFSKYTNVIGFSAGNEVNHVAPAGKPEQNAPCQKKFIKDMRKYINSCTNMRKIPVGVVLADSDRKENALYYNCRSDSNDVLENAEWYGLNVYLHCDGKITDIKESAGFHKLYNDFDSYNYSIPLILTEFGCLSDSFSTINGFGGQRNFLQANWILSSTFRDQIAGGFAFEYSTELSNSKSTSPYPFKNYGPQNYGLGYFSPENCDEINIPCKYNKMPNFDNLATQYNKSIIDTTEYKMKDFKPSANRIEPSICPSQFPKLASFTWLSDSVNNLACPTNTFTCTGKTITTGNTDGTNTGTINTSNNNTVNSNSPNIVTNSGSYNNIKVVHYSIILLSCFYLFIYFK